MFLVNSYFCTIWYLSYINMIKEVLEERGIKQIWLYKKLYKSYNIVSAYVQKRQQRRLEVLNDIVEILDVDVMNLIQSNK